ncbi:MAG: hypothetical protein JJ873_16250 [Maricaulis sp.]|uniref:hypothetical protein n=1 Tax=Pseudomonadota TaxID=1224 RepID=UPI001B12E61E|nr:MULTISPECIES: hypothetical protein [Pseudomonadota]MBO6697172.1 hypothetical protein [Henriciella sp.]MBO6731061.1 hypothetical protein [Maricaulis sp.]MBO6813211.1 hypothetical protein [Marinobacter sp.]MBO6878932.1 hypothetical protein [Maricaulis sp.]
MIFRPIVAALITWHLACPGADAHQADRASWALQEDEQETRLSLGWSESETTTVLSCQSGSDHLRLATEIVWEEPYPRTDAQRDRPGAYNVNAFPIELEIFVGPPEASITTTAEGWPNDVTGNGLIVELDLPLSALSLGHLIGSNGHHGLQFGVPASPTIIALSAQDKALFGSFWRACNKS